MQPSSAFSTQHLAVSIQPIIVSLCELCALAVKGFDRFLTAKFAKKMCFRLNAEC